MLKISHCPDGKITDLLAATHALQNCERFGQLQGVRAAETLHISHRPRVGDSRFARCIQGGGVYVQGGTVAISSCFIEWNYAYQVRACSNIRSCSIVLLP